MTRKEIQSVQEIVADQGLASDEWTPAPTLDELEGLDKENFRYRWVIKRPARVKAKMAEGWLLVNELDGDHIFHKRARTGSLDSGSSLTTEIDFRELVLMKLPMARAEARDRYYQGKADQGLRVINQDVKQAAQSLGGSVETRAKIQTNSGTTVID